MAGHDLTAERLAVAADRERRGAREADQRAYALGDRGALHAARRCEPLAVRGHGARGKGNLVAAGAVGEGARHGGKPAGAGVAPPQNHGRRARLRRLLETDEPARDRDLVPGGGRIRRRVDRHRRGLVLGGGAGGARFERGRGRLGARRRWGHRCPTACPRDDQGTGYWHDEQTTQSAPSPGP